MDVLHNIGTKFVNIRQNSSWVINYRTITATFLVLCATLATQPVFAINANKVLAELEATPSNWTQTTVRSWINEFEQDSNQSVALGDNITVSIDSNTPAHFLLALVDSYGEVKIIKPDNSNNGASYQFTASEPVGQYSLFTFASESEIPANLLGVPEDQKVYAMDYNMGAVETFVASLNAVSVDSPIAKAPEYQFLVEDASLALQTRGLVKKVARLQKNKKKESPVKKPLVVVAKKDVAKPVVVSSTQADTVAATPTPTEPVAALTVVETVTIVEESIKKPEPVAKAQVSVVEVAPTAAEDSLSLDIKFQVNSASLTPKGINALDSLGSALLAIQRNGELPTVMLEGHTDDTGDADYNLILSEERADTARNYLMDRFGLPKESIQSAGFGETAPVTPNTDGAARQTNRRVELKVVN